MKVRATKDPGLYHDGAGLYLQVANGGSKSWIFRFTQHKKTRDMGLGSADTFSLAEARSRAHRARQLLADGIDPIDQRQAETNRLQLARANEQKLGVTFASCAKE